PTPTTDTHTLPLHDALPILEAGHARRLAEDRVPVGRDVVRAGPLTQHLQIGEARHQRHHLARQRLQELQPRAHLNPLGVILDAEDRKSTRLNSSHVAISYAV